MPNLHDIERRIGSVSSTKQITRTMEMVAAAKIRLAGERVAAATPYAESMVEMLANVAKRVGGSENALLRKHDEVKNVLIVVVVSDRGLAGGFNSNVLRHAEKLIKEKLLARLERGCLCCLMGVAFMVLYFFLGVQGEDFITVVGAALIAIGIAFLISYFVGRRMLAKEMEAEQQNMKQE